MLWLRLSAGLLFSVGAGFGLPLPLVASYLLRNGRLPIFLGLFPAYGGGFLDGRRPTVFVGALAGFAATNAALVFAAVLVWGGHRLGAAIAVALLPVEIFFWLGFALPIPPAATLLALTALWLGRASLV